MHLNQGHKSFFNGCIAVLLSQVNSEGHLHKSMSFQWHITEYCTANFSTLCVDPLMITFTSLVHFKFQVSTGHFLP